MAGEDLLLKSAPTTEDEVDRMLEAWGRADRANVSTDLPQFEDAVNGGLDIRDTMEKLQRECLDILSPSVEVEFKESYRPTRSHFSPCPCIILRINRWSEIKWPEKVKLRQFARENATSLQLIKGFFVRGVQHQRDTEEMVASEPLLYIVSDFLASVGPPSSLELNMFEFDVVGPVSSVRTDATDMSELATTLQKCLSQMTYFRWNAGLSLVGDGHLTSHIASDVVTVVADNWSSPHIPGDYFEIASNYFFTHVHPDAVKRVCAVDLGCKMRIDCGKRQAGFFGMANFAEGVCSIRQKGPNELVLAMNDVAALHYYRILDSNMVFAKITLNDKRTMRRVTPSLGTGGIMNDSGLVRMLSQSAFRGKTESVVVNIRPTWMVGEDVVPFYDNLARTELSHNYHLKEFVPYLEANAPGLVNHPLKTTRVMKNINVYLYLNRAERRSLNAAMGGNRNETNSFRVLIELYKLGAPAASFDEVLRACPTCIQRWSEQMATIISRPECH